MLKLVDRPDLGSGVARRVGSSPTTCTEEGLQVIDLQTPSFLFILVYVQIWT